MKSIQEFESLFRQLMEQANQLDISVTGVISYSKDNLCGFGTQVEDPNLVGESFKNIQTLVAVKGSISEFLCELSSIDSLQNNSSLEIEGEHLSFTKCNPQVLDTKH